MPSYTFIASAHAVCNAGLTPYLTDVDPYSMVITPEIAERALRQLPQQPAAVFVISALGAPPDVRHGGTSSTRTAFRWCSTPPPLPHR